MKISKSKQELARIISENGGWRDGADTSAQSKSDNAISFYCDAAYRDGDRWWGRHITGGDVAQSLLLQNWHQTILSREEYFHLYPAPDAKPRFCESVMRSIPEPEAKPTIEQLAAYYRNAKDYAERKQQEADAAKDDADAKLKALELASEALGFLVTPITAKQESGLVITDWRQWKVGDYVSWSIISRRAEFKIISVHHDESREIGDFEITDEDGYVFRCYGDECKFIRRP